MTYEALKQQAHETAKQVRRAERLAFQYKHPQYTPPPPDEAPSAQPAILWRRWREANLVKHGIEGTEGCKARFGELWDLVADL